MRARCVLGWGHGAESPILGSAGALQVLPGAVRAVSALRSHPWSSQLSPGRMGQGSVSLPWGCFAVPCLVQPLLGADIVPWVIVGAVGSLPTGLLSSGSPHSPGCWSFSPQPALQDPLGWGHPPGAAGELPHAEHTRGFVPMRQSPGAGDGAKPPSAGLGAACQLLPCC